MDETLNDRVEEVIQDMYEECDDTLFSIADVSTIVDELIKENIINWSLSYSDDYVYACWMPDNIPVSVQFYSDTFGEAKDLDGVIDLIVVIDERFQEYDWETFNLNKK